MLRILLLCGDPQSHFSSLRMPSLLNSTSVSIISLFTKYSLSRYHRDNLKLYVQRPKCDLLCSSFFHQASILWNNLPAFLKSTLNIESFKWTLKAKCDILDNISFNGIQGSKKDTANYICWNFWFCLTLFTVIKFN